MSVTFVMKVPYLFTAILVASSAQAADVCDKAYTTIEINQCGEFKHQEADKTLNTAYQAALRVIESIEDKQQRDDTRHSLVEAQRLWVRFRDKDCAAVYALWSDGTIRGAMFWGCMVERTKQRTKELESFNYQEPQT